MPRIPVARCDARIGWSMRLPSLTASMWSAPEMAQPRWLPSLRAPACRPTVSFGPLRHASEVTLSEICQPPGRVTQMVKRPKMCAQCGHRKSAHTSQGCLVCAKCQDFVLDDRLAPSPRKQRCRCLHRAVEHGAPAGRCRAVACCCAQYRALSEPGQSGSTSVRTVSGGAFESSRRRH